MKNNHNLHIILPILILIFILLFLFIINIHPTEKKSDRENELYIKEFSKLTPHFIKSEAQINGKPLEFILLPNNGLVYILPKKAAEAADVLISYGINIDSSFEESFSEYYDKHTYGYDCALTKINNYHPKTHYAYECIGTDEFILKWNKSSGIIHRFEDVLKKNNLFDKKFFVKISIGGAETHVYKQILKYSKNITGFAFVVHSDHSSQIPLLNKMLKDLEKDFILVRRHTLSGSAEMFPSFNLPNWDGIFTRAMVLIYINKNLVDNYKVSMNQHSSYPKWECFDEKVANEEHPTNIAIHKILPIVVYKTVEKFFTFDLPRKLHIIKKERTTI